MGDRSRILCIGAAHWDMIGRTRAKIDIGDDVPGTIERRLGGVASNVALGLAKRGLSVGLCSVVGDDDAGLALLRDLTKAGVDCSDVLRINGSVTGQYIAIEDDRGDLFGAIADASVLDEHTDQLVQQAELAVHHARTTLLEANLSMSALRQIAQAIRKAGGRIVANPVSPARARRLAFLLSQDFSPTIVANLAEANVLLSADCVTTLDAAKVLQMQSSGTVLVTDGARPTTLATPQEVITVTPPVLPSETSVTGAGDALLSAYLAARDRDDAPRTALNLALEAAAGHMQRTK